MNTQSPEVNAGCLPLLPPTLLFRQGLSLDPELIIQLDWLAREPLIPVFLCVPLALGLLGAPPLSQQELDLIARLCRERST